MAKGTEYCKNDLFVLHALLIAVLFTWFLNRCY